MVAKFKFLYPLYLHFYELLTSKKTFGNKKPQKPSLANIFFGPPAAILNFALKCKQTAISQDQELSMVNKFLFTYFFIT